MLTAKQAYATFSSFMLHFQYSTQILSAKISKGISLKFEPFWGFFFSPPSILVLHIFYVFLLFYSWKTWSVRGNPLLEDIELVCGRALIQFSSVISTILNCVVFAYVSGSYCSTGELVPLGI